MYTKSKLTIFLLFLFFTTQKCFSQMAVLGNNIARFYFVDQNGQLFNVIFEHVWVSVNNDGAFSGIVNYTGNLVLQPLSDLLPEDKDNQWPTQKIACNVARREYGKENVSCLPWVQTGPQFLQGYCLNNPDSNACSIKMGGGISQTATDGDFKF